MRDIHLIHILLQIHPEIADLANRTWSMKISFALVDVFNEHTLIISFHYLR
jgi:hypothetical protein